MNSWKSLAAAFALTAFTIACTPPPPGSPRSAHDADGDHDGDADEGEGSLSLPTDAATMAAAQRLSVTPSALQCPTEVLGIVDVHENSGSKERALFALRVRAVMLGAEALTNVEFRHGEHAEKLHLSGTAVRCHDLLRGRRYDVLATLDVVKPMGHEEDAFAELRARGRAVGANLIVDVHFDHGDDLHTRITGKAVRAHDPP